MSILFYMVRSARTERSFLERAEALAYAMGVDDASPGSYIAVTGHDNEGQIKFTIRYDREIAGFVPIDADAPVRIPNRCGSTHEALRCELFDGHRGEHFNNHNATTWAV